MNQEIEIFGIKKRYGRREILKGVDLSVPFSSCIGILGGNGSGKTTLLSILAGIIEADAGKFCCEGYDLLKDAGRRRFLVGIIPQDNPLIDELSCYDNLKLWYNKRELKQAVSGGIVKKIGVGEFLHQRADKLSTGMKKRLSIACALAHNPRVILMDEPSAALDLIAKDIIHSYIKEFVKNGGIVILVTHDEGELGLCDKHYILRNGILTEYSYDGNIKNLVGLIGG